MKFWVFSDLHVDVNRGYRLPKVWPKFDAVIIAGDICEGAADAVKWIGEMQFGKPVGYVAGNHDYYRTQMISEIELAREEAAKYPRVHFLEQNRVVFQVGDEQIDILGTTLWTDYLLDGEAWQTVAMGLAEGMMADHMLIRRAGSRWRPKHALAEHEGMAGWLKSMLGENKRGKTVVVTHHAPTRKSISPKYVSSALNPAYASNLEALVVRADLWIHGHIHARSDYMVDECRVVANPRGYVGHGESDDFDPSFVVEV